MFRLSRLHVEILGETSQARQGTGLLRGEPIPSVLKRAADLIVHVEIVLPVFIIAFQARDFSKSPAPIGLADKGFSQRP